MNNRLRQFWFRHYWWIIPIVFLILVICVFRLSGTKDPLGLTTTLAGVALTLVYFVQKQKLEEVQVFEKLFTQFNNRYKELNDMLEDIVADKTKSEQDVRKTLNHYFNLCAEEYLFNSEGRIQNSAWRAWCRGMLYYLKDARIREYWDRETKPESHYGLTLEVIQAGAA